MIRKFLIIWWSIKQWWNPEKYSKARSLVIWGFNKLSEEEQTLLIDRLIEKDKIT